MGDNDLAGKAPEVGDGVVLQHGPHLKGRAGQHQHVDAPGFKGAAGSGAHRVVENGAVCRKLRLLAVVFRHGQMNIPREISPDGFQHILPQHQGLAEGLADGLLGQVVIGGTQASGGEDDVRPLPGNFQSLSQPGGIVPHHGVPEHVDAHAAQGLGQLLGVGVDNVAEEQLRAHGDDLSGMRHSCSFFQASSW